MPCVRSRLRHDVGVAGGLRHETGGDRATTRRRSHHRLCFSEMAERRPGGESILRTISWLDSSRASASVGLSLSPMRTASPGLDAPESSRQGGCRGRAGQAAMPKIAPLASSMRSAGRPLAPCDEGVSSPRIWARAHSSPAAAEDGGYPTSAAMTPMAASCTSESQPGWSARARAPRRRRAPPGRRSLDRREATVDGQRAGDVGGVEESTLDAGADESTRSPSRTVPSLSTQCRVFRVAAPDARSFRSPRRCPPRAHRPEGLDDALALRWPNTGRTRMMSRSRPDAATAHPTLESKASLSADSRGARVPVLLAGVLAGG